MMLRWLSVSSLCLILALSLLGFGCGSECPPFQTKCGESCADLQANRSHCGACGTRCKSGEICNLGRCSTSCQEGLTLCEGRCANTKIDSTHCGKCGKVCAAGELCKNGVCTVSCPASQERCDNACVNTKTNAMHCGKCGTSCAQGEACQNGACKISCPSSQAVCNNRCVNLQADRLHCGACEKSCEPGQICDAGACKTSCQKERTNCNGACVHTQTDSNHCGACNKVCEAGKICQKGQCELNCEKGFATCQGSCVNTKVSRAHCGKCGASCSPGEVCKDGTCTLSCPKELTKCQGKCVNTKASSTHCGACDTTCGQGEVCQSGTCKLFCQTGFTSCKGACVNFQSDPKHCGGCEKKCNTGEACNQGKCEAQNQCTNGEILCGQSCIQTSFDTAHCGGCGKACKAGEACLQGACKTCSDCATWATQVGSFNNEVFTSVAVDKQNNIYAIGSFDTALQLGKTIINSQGGSDVLVVKMSPNGSVLWAQSAGGRTPDYGYGISSDGAGNVYVTGVIQGNATFGAINVSARGGFDFFVAKLDAKGNWQWVKTYGSSSADFGYSIVADPTGNTYVTGRFYSTVVFDSVTLTSQGGGDIFVAKWDPKGKVLWAKSAGSSSTEEGSSVTLDGQGNVYVAGRFYSSVVWGTSTLSSRGSSDVFVVKFNSAGRVQWAASGGSRSTDFGTGVAVDSKGNVAVTGRAYLDTQGATFGATTLTGGSNTDIFVGLLRSTGQWAWAVKAGSASTDYATGVGFDSTGNVFATGYFYNLAIFGNLQIQSSSSNAQLFVTQISSSGKIQGVVSSGGSASNIANAIALDNKDNIIVAGYASGLSTFGDYKLVANGGRDALVAKYSKPSGTLCPRGYLPCSGACTRVQSDTQNCGACGQACQSSQLCILGQCVAPPKGIVLSEIHVGAPDYVVIKNTSNKDVNLAGMVLYLNGNSSFTVTDINYTIPSFTLKAGAAVYLVEFSSKAGEFNPGSIPYTNFTRFSALLCLGPCKEKDGSNVLDAINVGAKRALPKGVSIKGDFTPNMSLAQESSSSYLRTGTQGAHPTFDQADWSIGKKTR